MKTVTQEAPEVLKKVSTVIHYCEACCKHGQLFRFVDGGPEVCSKKCHRDQVKHVAFLAAARAKAIAAGADPKVLEEAASFVGETLRRFEVEGEGASFMELREVNGDDHDFLEWLSTAKIGDVYPTFHGLKCVRTH